MVTHLGLRDQLEQEHWEVWGDQGEKPPQKIDRLVYYHLRHDFLFNPLYYSEPHTCKRYRRIPAIVSSSMCSCEHGDIGVCDVVKEARR